MYVCMQVNWAFANMEKMSYQEWATPIATTASTMSQAQDLRLFHLLTNPLHYRSCNKPDFDVKAERQGSYCFCFCRFGILPSLKPSFICNRHFNEMGMIASECPSKRPTCPTHLIDHSSKSINLFAC